MNKLVRKPVLMNLKSQECLVQADFTKGNTVCNNESLKI